MDDAPWGVVVAGLLVGGLFLAFGWVSTTDWRSLGSRGAQTNADLFRLTGARRRRYLTGQRVMGRLIDPLFLAVGLFAAVVPALSRVL